MKRQIGIITAMTIAMTGMMAISAPAETEKEETVIVRTNIGSEPDNLHPWLSAASDTEAIFHNVFEGLVLFDETGAIIPGLAEDWDISDDGLTYTFYLRDDVTFHNGKKMTAEDVIYTFETLSGLNGEDALSSKFTAITAIEAEDEYTVTMTLNEANSAFLQYTRIAVLPKDYEEQSTAPIGTGPFMFVEYIPGQKVVLEKNDAYYEESRMPQINQAEIYVITDESAVMTAMQAGQLDVALLYSDNAEYLSGDFEILSSPQNMVQLFAMNNSTEPFDDIRVRQAFEYVIDKQMIIDTVFSGYATELYSNFSPVMAVYYNDELSEYYETDVEKAQELMKEAGYEGGFEITIKVPSNYPLHVDSALVIAEQLKQIGVEAELELVEWATWLEDVYSNAEYETTIIGLTGKLDPNDILGRYVSDYGKNFFQYENETYDELMEEALTADEETRIEIYKECQKILTEDAAAVWISDPHQTVVVRSDLKGYTFYPLSFIDLSKLYYEE